MLRKLAVLGLSLLVVAGCAPSKKGTGSTRYIDRVFAEVVATPNIAYAVAPDLVTGAPVVLNVDLYEPAGDTLAARPAVLWIHGGGFRTGSKAGMAQIAREYAQRGYVTLAVQYRLDPGNQCQDLQDGGVTDPVALARCQAAIAAAQHDTQAAIRWLRGNAANLRVDPTKLAVGGFSAGAITALNVGYRSDDPGDVGDYDGLDSSIRVALSASGCNYDLNTIGPGDAAAHYLHAQLDPLVPFGCAVADVDRAHDVGLAADTMFFTGEATHANALYNRYKASVDAAWTRFLVVHLQLS